MTDLLPGLERFWIGMAMHLWQTTLFLLGLVLIAWLLNRSPARMQSALYWTGVVKLLPPLPLLGPASLRLVDLLRDGVAGAPSVPEAGWGVRVVILPTLLDPGSPGWSHIPAIVYPVLTVIWVVGLVAVLTGLRSYRRGCDVAEGRLAASTEARLRAALPGTGLDRCDIAASVTAQAPCVRGVLHPRIAIGGELIDALATSELRAVLLHEAQHLRRRDPARYTVLAIVRGLFFFYPPVWWLSRRIRETTEMACDEAVVRAGVSPADYCLSLARTVSLAWSTGGSSTPVGVLGHRVSFLSRRLERVRSGGRFEAMHSHRIGLAIAAVGALVLSTLPLPQSIAAPGQSAAPVPDARLEQLESADLPVTLEFRQARLAEILETIAGTGGLDIEITGELPERPVDFHMMEVPLATALEGLGSAAGIRYHVIGPRRLEVRPVLLAGSAGVGIPQVIPDSRVVPVYPEKARIEHVEGRVILQAVIGRDGSVSQVEVLNVDPLGFGFAQSATDAVGQWRYEPARRGGKLVDVYFTVRINFDLRDDKEPEEREL